MRRGSGGPAESGNSAATTRTNLNRDGHAEGNALVGVVAAARAAGLLPRPPKPDGRGPCLAYPGQRCYSCADLDAFLDGLAPVPRW